MTKLQDFLNSSVRDVTAMRGRGAAGDLFGVELECEGKSVDFGGDDNSILNDWQPHQDGSLRNNHGQACEWVFNGPAPYNKAIQRVDTLFDYFDKRKARLVCSNRTSTHVHFNMSDKKAYQVVNMFILFCILEEILDHYCGEDRVGNLFCLSSRHAEAQVRWVERACFRNFNLVFDDNGRYCSLNLAALNKFGSVEFRAMRGLDNREDLKAWLGILNEFCEYACYKMRNPVELLEQISFKTPIGFLKEIFSPGAVRLLTQGLEEHVIHQSIYDGLRRVQMLCYRIGTEFDQVRLQGKDFWASFQKDAVQIDQQAPGLGVDPFPRLRIRPNRRAPQNPFEEADVPAPQPPEPIMNNQLLQQAMNRVDQEMWVRRWEAAAANNLINAGDNNGV